MQPCVQNNEPGTCFYKSRPGYVLCLLCAERALEM
jgi:hypothetical protein